MHEYLRKSYSPPRSARLRDFQNQEYRFSIPKSKRRRQKNQEEEHSQSQSVMRFTQMEVDVDDDLTLIWVGLLEIPFEVERMGEGGKINPLPV